MRARTFSLVMLALGIGIGCGFHAQQTPFSISISTPKQDYVLGEPVCVTVRLTNISKERITFEQPVPDFNLLIPAKSDEGMDSGIGEENTTYVTGHSEIQDQQNDGSCTLPPGGTVEVTRCGALGLVPAPSAWQIWAEFKGRGRSVTTMIEGEEPKKWNCEGCWKGSVQSNKVTIHFDTPTGADQNAFYSLVKPFIANFKGGNSEGWLRDTKLITEYPGSVYAAWGRFMAVMTWMNEGYGGSYINNPSSIAILPGIRSYYSPANQRESAKHENQRAPYLIEQCRAILRYHPELEPVASVTRVNLAALLFITGDTPGATEQLGLVIKAHPEWDEGKAAQKMLDVISAPAARPGATTPSIIKKGGHGQARQEAPLP